MHSILCPLVYTTLWRNTYGPNAAILFAYPRLPWQPPVNHVDAMDEKEESVGTGEGLWEGLREEWEVLSLMEAALRVRVVRIMLGTNSGCRRACLLRWSLRMKRLSHSGHANLFSPVCVLWCLASSSDRANLLPQPSHSQGKGRSPVCVLRWAFRWELFPYTFEQPA